jgi:hypothetical protein
MGRIASGSVALRFSNSASHKLRSLRRTDARPALSPHFAPKSKTVRSCEKFWKNSYQV